jgi:catechol 2,3-dioxygenase-like lactoylglutathione lyase family enzyme
MGLHTLRKIVLGAPNVEEAAGFYTEFGLTPLGEGRFASADGGELLQRVTRPTRRLVAVTIGVDDRDDLFRAQADLARQGFDSTVEGQRLTAVEPVTGVTTRLEVEAPITVPPPEQPAVEYNAPGRIIRTNARALPLDRKDDVRPRKLGHVVLGSTDLETSMRFFRDGIGFKVSDMIQGRGSFMRCSTDHHNLLVQNTPVNFVHHSSWQVDDVDEVGRGASRLLEADPNRHVWGLGRHHIGSNFFWYLRDPSGTFAEYYSDLDTILEDELWSPEVFEGKLARYNWGPPPPPSFIRPDDLAEIMAGAHTPGG